MTVDMLLGSYSDGWDFLWVAYWFLVGSYGCSTGSYGISMGVLDRPAMKGYKSFVVGLSCPPLSLLSCVAFCFYVYPMRFLPLTGWGVHLGLDTMLVNALVAS